VKKKIVAAWVLSVITLLVLIMAAPIIIKGSLSAYDFIAMLLAGLGAALGISTWGSTERSKVGLAGGIFGAMVFFGYITCVIIWIIDVL